MSPQQHKENARFWSLMVALVGAAIGYMVIVGATQ